MSKEGNMEELQRWENDLRYGNPLSRAEDGAWVRFSDVQEREARFQARIEELAQDRDDMTDTILGLRERIEELEVIVSGKTMYDGAEASEARWRERIQELIDDWPENATWNESEEAADAWTAATGQLRSLLDSGEQKECPDCEGQGSIEYTNGPLARCGRCSGSGRATPSPAFHREGREQFCPEKTQKNWTTDGRSAPVAVPEKVEVNRGAVDSLDGCPFCTKPGECGGSGHRATTPSPALEGRGDFVGDDLSGVHTCHAGCPCQNRATGEADKARKCVMCDGTGHVWDGPEGDQTYVGPCSCRATGEDCPDCGGSGVKGENPIGLSRSCLKCGGSGRATEEEK